eukprot:jgi/Picsp_1/2462/NSC_05923-R1_methyltransferase family
MLHGFRPGVRVEIFKTSNLTGRSDSDENDASRLGLFTEGSKIFENLLKTSQSELRVRDYRNNAAMNLLRQSGAASRYGASEAAVLVAIVLFLGLVLTQKTHFFNHEEDHPQFKATLLSKVTKLSKCLSPDMTNIAPAGVRQEIAGELKIQSTSQYGQDAWIYSTFHDILPLSGSFIEFGGRDGALDSNTNFYDKVLNYKGFLVESVPEEYRQLVKNRERVGVNTYHGLVCARNEKKKLFAYDLHLAGLGMIFTEAEREQVVSKLEKMAKERKSAPDIKEVELECYDLQDLARKNNLDRITLMSVDCEGCELAILKDFDFTEHQVSIILVEINDNIEEILKVLFANGFVPLDARTSDIILVHVDFLRQSKKLFSHYQSIMELDAQSICKFLNSKSDKDI